MLDTHAVIQFKATVRTH